MWSVNMIGDSDEIKGVALWQLAGGKRDSSES
jgi:hypothetical protein